MELLLYYIESPDLSRIALWSIRLMATYIYHSPEFNNKPTVIDRSADRIGGDRSRWLS